MTRPVALPWSIDSLRLMTSTWFPLQPAQQLGQRPAQPVQRRHLHTVARGESGLWEIQPRPVPRDPAADVIEDLLAVGQHPALRAEVVVVAGTDTRAYP